MTIRILATACFSMSCLVLRGQFDSLPLPVERLSEADILSLKGAGKQTLVLSATRTPTELDDQPFTMKVFTSEDILNNGWITLCDVLRHAPGIRVSQPGNGLDGDMFLMRGLPGNGYARIMINDIPIKPSVTQGMPLGAQLPIRQAERIEILYGPAAAAIYGDEATAGVINIILKETERPLFTQADLSFGRNGFNSLDLFFGGKFGRDKNIFRFAIYGSSTVLNDRDLFHDEDKKELFNLKNYLFPWIDSTYWAHSNNLRPDLNVEKFPGELITVTSKTPHESRLFGFNLRWRGIHFSYDEMYRRDHSSIGLNPRAASFASSYNFVGERIRVFSLGARRERTRRSFSFNLSMEQYQMDDRSAWLWVMPQFGLEYFDHIDPTHSALSPQELDDFQWSIPGNYFNDSRYGYSAAADFRYDLRWTRRFKYGWQFDIGHSLLVSFQRPLEQFSFEAARPEGFFQLKGDFATPVSAGFINRPDDEQGKSNLNFQLQWKRPNWHLVGSAMLQVSPEFSAFYSLAAARKLTSWIQLRATASRADRTPGYFYNSTTFRIATVQTPFVRQTTLVDNRYLKEKTGNLEAGIRLKIRGGGSIDAAVFASRTDNLLANGHAWPAIRADTFFGETKANLFGWKNDGNSIRLVSGLQADLRFEPTSSTFHWFKIEKEIVTQNSASLAWTKGKNRAPDSPTIFDFVPNQPAFIFRWQTEISGPKTRLVFRINSQSDAKSHFPFWAKKWAQPTHIPQGSNKFTTLDLVLRRSLSKNFQIYLSMTNLFNRHFAGLDATGTPDDLLFNPQPGRQTRFGINYNMN